MITVSSQKDITNVSINNGTNALQWWRFSSIFHFPRSLISLNGILLKFSRKGIWQAMSVIGEDTM